jgi:hypothetical protein
MDTLDKIFFTFAVIALVCYFAIKAMGKYKGTFTQNAIVILAVTSFLGMIVCLLVMIWTH